MAWMVTAKKPKKKEQVKAWNRSWGDKLTILINKISIAIRRLRLRLRLLTGAQFITKSEGATPPSAM